jgi:hypothetical protein
MERALRTTVTTQAKKVRAWCEAENGKREFPKHTEGLCGWCAIASARLWRELLAQGVKSELHIASNEGISHVFVIVDDYIVDVTATQFRAFANRKLVIMHAKEGEVHWFYRSHKVFDNPDDLRARQVADGWPTEQTVPA